MSQVRQNYTSLYIVYIFRNQDSEVEGDSNGDLQIASPGNSEAQQALAHFWPKAMEEIKNITTVSKTNNIFNKVQFSSTFR